jgi:hypothetical protein
VRSTASTAAMPRRWEAATVSAGPGPPRGLP